MLHAQLGQRVSTMILLAGALAVALALGKHRPKEQTVHYVLGDSAGRVEEIDASWFERGEDDESQESLRDVSFRYVLGRAPRVVTHEARLADGDYTVKIEIVAVSGRTVVERHVRLSGEATSIDVADAVGLQPGSRVPAPALGTQ
jgi:hypothetical protein